MINFIYGYLDLANECNIEISKRIRIGNADISETDCVSNRLEHTACFENGYGCYRSKYHIPGFQLRHGDYSSYGLNDPDAQNIGADDIQGCANLCFRNRQCKGFLMTESIHSNGFCFLKTVRSKIGHSGLMGGYYQKYATSTSTCVTGGCEGVPKQVSDTNINSCQELCIRENCQYFTLGPDGCALKGNCKFIENDVQWITCSAKKIKLQKSAAYDENSITSVTDKNNQTCIEIRNSPFVIRYPFPGVDKPLSSTKVKIIGSFLDCSIVSGRRQANLFVYVPVEPVIEAKFPGSYKSCTLLTSLPSQCDFSCDCGERFCEGIYVNAYTSSSKIDICEIYLLDQ